MNARLERFVTALESGKYHQTYGRLRREDTFCVWGVACDIYNPKPWRVDEEGNYHYLGFETDAPLEVVNYFGLSYPQAERLIERNDRGDSFVKIAQYLRKTYE